MRADALQGSVLTPSARDMPDRHVTAQDAVPTCLVPSLHRTRQAYQINMPLVHVLSPTVEPDAQLTLCEIVRGQHTDVTLKS